MICYLYDAPSYLFLTTGVPELLYYSHIPTTLISLFFGIFILFNNPRNILNRLFFLISLTFSVWTLSSLTAWTNINADFIVFIWPLFTISTSLIAVLSIFFAITYFRKDTPSLTARMAMLILLLPALLFSHTDLNFSGFDITNCDAFLFENILFKIYSGILGLITVFWVGYEARRAHKRAVDSLERRQIILMSTGLEVFVVFFLSTTLIVTYLVNIGLLPDSRLEMYGLFGMTAFLVMISFIIVEFKAFNISMTPIHALVIGLIIIVSSQFTYYSTPTTLVLKVISLILTLIVARMLVTTARREIHQRKNLESYSAKLAEANDRLRDLDKTKSEFLSIASHQLRSPITAIRGYSSLLLDGSFGKPLPEMVEPLQRIEQSSKLMAQSIEDYLNISRIESGNMKYDYSDFNLKDETEHACDDLRKGAIERGLMLIFRSDLRGRGIVHADIGKTIQIVQNLITNAIKYTEKGSIKVLVRDDIGAQKIYVDIIDTGIGIKQEEVNKIFEKFERAKNANSVNIHGTGLGLYVAHKMAVAMGGAITVHSDGENKGSCFTLTLPLVL